MQKFNTHSSTSSTIKLKTMARKDTGDDNFKFTVSEESKVQKLEAEKVKVQESSWSLSIFKILLTGFIAVAFLFSVVATKLTVVAIGQQFNVSCTEPSCILEKENEAPYIMMILIMMIPQFISFISALGNSAFSNEPWPSKQALVWVSLYLLFITHLLVYLTHCFITLFIYFLSTYTIVIVAKPEYR